MTRPKEQPALARLQLPDNRPPVYQGGNSFEEHVDAWETIEASRDTHNWYLGAIAASLDTGYGRSSIKEFASAVRKSPERIYQILKTYRTFEGQDVSPELWFSHYQWAAESKDPQYWIRRALDERISTNKLKELILGKPLPDMRFKEVELAQDAEFKPVTSNGYGPFPPDELIQPESHDDPYRGEEATERPTKARPTLKRWYGYVASHSCYVCGADEVEIAHIQCLPSTKHSWLIPRHSGLGDWPCLPICPEHHRHGPDSIHAIGERNFFDAYRGMDHAIGFAMRLMLEFFLE